MVAAIYARKSTEQLGVADEQKSVARQVDNARAFASSRGWTIDEAHVYRDEAISGAEVRKLHDRQRLLRAIGNRPPFDALIMRDASRFSRRDGDEAFSELKAIALTGVDIWFYQDGTRFEFGTFGANVTGFVRAEMNAEYRRQIAQWTTEAMDRKARAGHVTGGRVFGYENVAIVGADGKRDHVERRIVEAEAAVVRRIFQLCARGLGKTSIAKRLNAERAPAPRPQQARPKAWAGSSVHEILNRELYRGVIVWNRTKKRDRRGEKNQQPRPPAEWVRRDAPTLRVVDDELWQAVQARLEAGRAVYLRGTKGKLWGRPLAGVDAKYLLTGLATCGSCGATLEVRSRAHGTGGHRTRRQFYMCSTNRRRGASICRGIDVPMDRANEALVGALEARFVRPDVLREACRRLVAETEAAGRHARATRGERLARKRELETQLARLTDSLAAAGGESRGILTALKARELELDAIDRDLARATTPKPGAAPAAMAKAVESAVAEWRGMLHDQAPVARELVTKLLRGRVVFVPEVQDEQPGFRLRGSASPEPLIRVLVAGGSAHKVASLSIPSWNQVADWLRDMRELRRIFGSAA